MTIPAFLLTALLSAASLAEARNNQPRNIQAASSVTVDGDVSDWPLLYRTYPKIWESPSLDPNFNIFGQRDEATSSYYFAIQRTDDGVIGAATTLFLDLDQSSSSSTTGALTASEYFIDFVSDATTGAVVPYLYTANPYSLLGPVTHSFDSSQKVIEIALPFADVGGDAGPIDFFVDVNDALFFPSFFGADWYVATSYSDLPARTVDPADKRIALVFNPESELELFGGGEVNSYIYRQLYASFQHQLMMAGLPYDLIYMEELKDLATIVKYDALLFPYSAYVLGSDHPIIAKNLRLAVHHYGIGIVAGDNFLTDLSGTNPVPLAQPYQAMWEILGINIIGFGAGDFKAEATGTSHPIMADYSAGETILEYTEGFYNHYGRTALPGVFETSSVVTVLAETRTDVHNHNAVLAIDTVSGARNVHFGTVNMMADGNLLWSALRWVVFGETSTVGLQISRMESVFSARNDVDLAMFPFNVEDTIKPLYSNNMQPWKDNFNFVGTYFITVGNDPAEDQYTDWSVSGPLYQDFIKDGNEIGSHSYTHPYFISDLSAEELEFEFPESGGVIETNLGLQDIGYAQPGNPESLRVVNILNDFGLNYFSGTYTGRGIGFPSAFGFLTPDATMCYMAPNMFSDFNLLGFKKLTPAQSIEIWRDQFQQLNNHASTPIIHYHWHDYGPKDYTAEIFDDTFEMAYLAGSEFITNMDLSERVKQMKLHSLSVEETVGVVTATVSGGDGFGRLALDAGCSNSEVIGSVDNWYAYSSKKVFLPSSGGSFTIRKGPSPSADLTRITDLPMRAELVTVSGDGTILEFSFVGNGKVIVELKSEFADRLIGSGASSLAKLSSTTLEMTFSSDKPIQTASIALLPPCAVGRKYDLSGYCVLESCNTNYICPLNSARITLYNGALRECFDAFGDCQCDAGYVRDEAAETCDVPPTPAPVVPPTPAPVPQCEAGYYLNNGQCVQDDSVKYKDCTDRGFSLQYCKNRYGRRLKQINARHLVENEDNDKCSTHDYDMFLVVSGAHFAGLAVPSTGASGDCQAVAFHAEAYEHDATLQKVALEVDPESLAEFNEENKLHLGRKTFSQIVDAFETAPVNKEGVLYDAISNNCVALLRNMADPLEIPVDERMIGFITRKLVESSSEQIFSMMKKSPTMAKLYQGGHRFLKGMSNEELLSRVIKLYV